jgi:hypothetical protein
MIKKGSCAFAYVLKTRTKTTVILNAISAYGVVKIKSKKTKSTCPFEEKKRDK